MGWQWWRRPWRLLWCSRWTAVLRKHQKSPNVPEECDALISMGRLSRELETRLIASSTSDAKYLLRSLNVGVLKLIELTRRRNPSMCPPLTASLCLVLRLTTTTHHYSTSSPCLKTTSVPCLKILSPRATEWNADLSAGGCANCCRKAHKSSQR